ncbi:MAG: aquaporin, partial [Lachnospiraceae bacterium]|nr:aquaporin [Lachnospiraceae bacterium]
AQCLGAFAGSGVLALIFSLSGIEDLTESYAANGTAGVGGSLIAAIIVELIATCIFVMTILGVTSKKQHHGSLAGIVIGLTLTAIHICTIGLTGTSVNPARSIGPAVVAALIGNLDPLKSLVAFVVGPILGAVAGAFIYKGLESEGKPEKKTKKKKKSVKYYDDDDYDDDDDDDE